MSRPQASNDEHSPFTRLLLVRHGETIWNTERRAQGHLDSPLTEKGLAQAEAIARRLRDRRLDALYSSDLGRAMQTAKAIANQNAIREVWPEAGLRERKLGVYQGLTTREFMEQHPEIAQRYYAADNDYCLPEGESRREFHQRCVNCFENLAKRHPGQTLLVVSHGGVLAGLFREVIGLPLEVPRQFEVFNASLGEVHYREGNWRLATWGDISHLPEQTFQP